MKKNIRYKPSKVNAGMTIVVGGVMAVIGLTTILPAALMSGFLPMLLFAVVWIGGVVAITVVNGLYLFGKRDNTNLFGHYEITDEDPPRQEVSSFGYDSPEHQHITPTGLDPKARLEQLETLKEAGLLTPEEYDQKRREILRNL